LPPLVGQEVTYRETQALLAEGDRPALDLLRELLGYIDPRLPYAELLTVWGAVAYYYPDADGLSLVDEWCSAARADNGQYSSPRTQPEKHAGFRRQTGRVATLGTLIHYAKLGGWRPPPQPLNAVTRGRRQRVEAKLDELPNPTYDDLPHFLQAMYDHLGPLVEGLPRDLVTVVSLSALSILWPGVRFENLPLSLFVNLIMEQGSGKSKITTELRRVLKLVKGMDAIPFTSGSPQGMYTALSKSDSKRMYASFDEFGDFLATLKHDYMANARGVLNSLYDGQDVAYQLSRSSVVIDNPYVVVVATTTPRMFLDNVTPADLEGGFASRFWYVAPWWENKGQHDYPKEAARVALANALAEHVAAHAHITNIRFDCPEGTVPPEYAEYEALCGINTGERRGIKDALDHPKTPKGRYLARVKRVAGGLEMLDIRPRVHGNVVVVRRAYLLLAIILVRRCEAYADLILDLVAATEDEGLAEEVAPRAGDEGGRGLARRPAATRPHPGARPQPPAADPDRERRVRRDAGRGQDRLSPARRGTIVAHRGGGRLMGTWYRSWNADPAALRLADRHYSRQHIGSNQMMPPGRQLVLVTGDESAVWGTAWPFAQYVNRAWPDAWLCCIFRNEGAHLSSDLIREAVAITRHVYGEPPPSGFITFIDTGKVRKKRDWGAVLQAGRVRPLRLHQSGPLRGATAPRGHAGTAGARGRSAARPPGP
jgi:hypothetical protein